MDPDACALGVALISDMSRLPLAAVPMKGTVYQRCHVSVQLQYDLFEVARMVGSVFDSEVRSEN